MPRRMCDDLDEQLLRLCAALDLDPTETTDVWIAIEPGRGAVARWEGARRVPLDKIAAAIEREQPEPWPDDPPWT